jgi:voltage-gated potassium channel
MKKPADISELGPFQLIILVLSFVALGALAAELLVTVPPEAQRLMRWIDNLICLFFLLDFAVRFHRAESKLQFMKWGWIDLLASIPEVNVLRWGRLFRIFRVLRLILVFRSVREFFGALFTSRTRGGIASVFAITFLVLTLASTGILFCERNPGSNIRTAEDAVWWSVTTITTVGYGDKFPVTTPGRMLAACLMFTGVGLFGTLSGVIASFFLGNGSSPKSPEDDTDLRAEVQALRSDLATLRREITPPPNRS